MSEQTNTDSVQTITNKGISGGQVAGGSAGSSLFRMSQAVAPPTIPLGVATKAYVDSGAGGSPVPPNTVLVDCETDGPPAADPNIANKLYVDTAIATAIAGIGSGTIRAGMPIILSPLVYPSNTVIAHGLAYEPDYVEVILECLVDDLGYVAGEKIVINPSLYSNDTTDDAGLEIIFATPATTFRLGLGLQMYIQNPSGTWVFIANVASWRVTATPYTFF